MQIHVMPQVGENTGKGGRALANLATKEITDLKRSKSVKREPNPYYHMGCVNEIVLDEAASDICSPATPLKSGGDALGALLGGCRESRYLSGVSAEVANQQITVICNKSLIRDQHC